jgi:hypothetical protein
MICVQNSSRAKSFTVTKRLITCVVPVATIRLNIGDVPKRVILKLIKDLRGVANKNTEVKIYFPDRDSFRGIKCVEIGKSDKQVACFKNSSSKLDAELKVIGIK